MPALRGSWPISRANDLPVGADPAVPGLRALRLKAQQVLDADQGPRLGDGRSVEGHRYQAVASGRRLLCHGWRQRERVDLAAGDQELVVEMRSGGAAAAADVADQVALADQIARAQAGGEALEMA